jgi:hypothetical protein
MDATTSDKEEDERFEIELSLLRSMYPGQIAFAEGSRGLTFSADAAGPSKLELQIPDGYPSTELPIVLAARVGRRDLRDAVHRRTLACPVGEEVLDAIVVAFIEICTDAVETAAENEEIPAGQQLTASSEETSTATVVVWLHHLLNTNKRKQALSPTTSGPVNGVTKPGYPGVLIFSGPAKSVQDHVSDLKHLNWQAFQVRLEVEEAWEFAHGGGIVEVESMKEIVAEIGDARKDLFMEAMRMKRSCLSRPAAMDRLEGEGVELRHPRFQLDR